LINKEKVNYYKFINMNVMALTFEIFSKNCGCFNALSIKNVVLLLLKAFLKIKNILIKETMMFLCY